jgi:hypothetical protein
MPSKIAPTPPASQFIKNSQIYAVRANKNSELPRCRNRAKKMPRNFPGHATFQQL